MEKAVVPAPELPPAVDIEADPGLPPHTPSRSEGGPKTKEKEKSSKQLGMARKPAVLRRNAHKTLPTQAVCAHTRAHSRQAQRARMNPQPWVSVSAVSAGS